MARPELLTIYTDGASRGNPGEAAFAFVIAHDGQTIAEQAGRLGRTTNNQAEYMALVRALEHALRLGEGWRLQVNSDSELMVKQMRGEYRVKNEELRPLYEQARRLADRFPAVAWEHVRREQNRRADELCNLVLDGRWDEDDIPPPSPANGPTLDDEVLACLRRGGAENAAALWRDLKAILQRHGLTVPPRRS